MQREKEKGKKTEKKKEIAPWCYRIIIIHNYIT